MKGTERGHRRFANWQRMTPSARASPKSSASVRFRWDSIAWGEGRETVQRLTATLEAGGPSLGSSGQEKLECQLQLLPLADTPNSSCHLNTEATVWLWGHLA